MALQKSPNATNGSWWIPSDPTHRECPRLENPPNGSWEIVQIQPLLNIEEGFAMSAEARRLDLNNPPTSVGGIQAVRCHCLVGWI